MQSSQTKKDSVPSLSQNSIAEEKVPPSPNPPGPPEPLPTRLLSLELTNFKCFKRRALIGPFERITGVVGPNGGGKSTVLEALGFCLCKDLVFRSKLFKYSELANADLAGSQQPVRARLALQFNGEDETLERALGPANDSAFLANGQKKTLDEFLALLEQRNLLGHLILQQEELQLFSAKSPAELMLLCEKLAGSFEFREAYLSTQRELDGLNFEIVEKNDQLKGLKRDKKHAKALLAGSQNVEKAYQELDEVERDLFELQLLRFELRLEEERRGLGALAEEAAALAVEIDRLGGQALRQRAEARKAVLAGEQRALGGKVAEAEAELLALEASLKEKGAARIAAERNSGRKAEELKALSAKRENLRAEENRLRAEIKNFEAEIERIKKHKAAFKNKGMLTDPVFEEFSRALQRQEAVFEAKSEELKAVSKDVEFLERRQAAVQQNLGALIARKNAEVTDLVNFERQLSIAEESLSALQSESADADKKLGALKHKRSHKSLLSSELSALRQRLRELEGQAASDRQQQSTLAHIGQITEGFYGEFALLVAPLDGKFALAVGTALVKILDHLLFESAQSAQKAAAVLKSHFIQRNALILENAPFRRGGKQSALAELRAFLGSQGHLAFDLVQIKHSVPFLKEFLEFFLNGVVVCESLQIAAKLKRELGGRVKKVVTLDGTVLKDREVSSLGAEARFPQKLKRFVREASRAEKRPAEIPENKPAISSSSRQELEGQIKRLEEQLGQIEEEERSGGKGEAEEKQARELQRRLAAAERERNALAGARDLAEGKIRSFEGEISELITKSEGLKQSLAQTSELRASEERQLLAQRNLIEELKADFLAKNKKLAASREELEQAISATKDSAAEAQKTREKILKTELEISALGLAELEAQLESEAGSLAQLEERARTLASQLESTENALEAAKANFLSLCDQKQVKENSIFTKEEELKSLLIKIKEIEQKLKTVKLQETEKRELMATIQLAREEFLEEQELRGSTVGADLRGRMQRPSKRGARSQLDIEPSDNPPEQFAYDFSRLLEMLQVASAKETNSSEIAKLIGLRAKKQEELKRRLKELTTSINSGALVEIETAKIAGISDKLKDLQAGLTELFAKEKEKKAALTAVAGKRGQRLLSFLNPLSLIIPSVYKFVNCDERATASFIIENPLRPFLGGLVFSATPPTKKFSIGTEGLSSGESSLANLAFFLAVNEVREAPAIFFDEVDAHLDAENVLKFVSAFGKCSAYKQVGFVSHKPFVFKNADVLLGVTKDAEENTAVCFSLDLRKKENGEE